MDDVIVVTSDYVPGHRIVKILGVTWGLTVRSRGLGGNLVAGLRTIAGGEIKEYVTLLNDARETALQRLISSAKAMGATAVINMRFDTSDMAQAMTEIVAYGTAVVTEPVENSQNVTLS
ncbi:YbjQ family protein [Picrophilus oshimae]|uniref:UPF0145 protein PTO0347 n=2 Tax=Picrophilus torridus (strain ATCC 700027 / DSM 9790 / JCM 10055 / NBRC 100828 / KAW 2/3) TaxID=1122961 RepID=Y347_PICTO|nr:heavy metal-binding domain-containing protein [Picrophilus oshimae]Q6L270.1 RecName: Full=UPF0145 protein PTO0347 [Picrophilus oshimae DSM 9789]AAT42932.1 hypothetical protein DUF 74 [Picrophilus oshimae DSM 9789]SMD30753.1 Uncharacterized conserved protein YbjQ, UPF0145 family [Picrophilus oshimae DSM 9789]